MGMGDRKPPFVPEFEPIMCDVTLKRFNKHMVRECPEPHVIARYGTGGIANVSIYICQKCKYKRTFQYMGAVGCNYGMEQGVSAGEKNKLG